MTMTSQIAVARITQKLGRTESTLDSLLVEQADLIATIVRAGMDLAASPASTQPTLMRLAKFQQTLIGARADLIRSHHNLLKVGQERGDILSGDCPTLAASHPAHLAAVA